MTRRGNGRCSTGRRRTIGNFRVAQVNAKERSILVLQGGGALGSYQGGVFEALTASEVTPDWVAGISIGAINAALIAGNPPGKRLEKLEIFWRQATSAAEFLPEIPAGPPRGVFNDISAAATTIMGAQGFFSLRLPPASLMPPGTEGASSYYDTAPLRKTLLELVDFDYLNSGQVRLSVGAVNVESGNMTWFDSSERTIGPEHIMASGALPPGFPAVEIDGQYFWDGGLVSNTPLQYVLDHPGAGADLCIFQIDLFNARGALPDSVWQVEGREKDIRFSSRTRLNTDMMRRIHELRDAARTLYDDLPEALKTTSAAKALVAGEPDPAITIAHLIYRQPDYEHPSKDYEFSRASMLDHWRAGREDGERTLAHPEWRARRRGAARVKVFDLTGDGVRRGPSETEGRSSKGRKP